MSNDNEVLVKVEGVSKIFCRDFKKSLFYGLQDSARDLLSWGKPGKAHPTHSKLNIQNSKLEQSDPSSHSRFNIQDSKLAQRELRSGEFLAVDNVSFELRRGECLGLIGRNGAGKTTLLKMLNGLIKPDSGRIEMRGRIGALIALGAGFNPILTGRENIYVNGSVIGLTKEEVDEKIGEIVDFAEIPDFIDAPVQTYSSGMQVRLGFAIASSLSPDILILDEVLAVGDFAFRQKCLRKVESMLTKSAVIFVSHNFDQVERICNLGMVFEKGVTLFFGATPKAKQIYDSVIEETSDGTRWLCDGLEITSSGNSIPLSVNAAGFNVSLNLRSVHNIENVAMRLRIKGGNGEYVGEYHSLNHGINLNIPRGTSVIDVQIPELALKRGKYSVDLFLSGAYNDLIKYAEFKPFATLTAELKSNGFNSVQF